MTKASTFILRLYFAVISAVTLFTLMFGTIDLLSIGLKTYVFTSADVPTYLESCSGTVAYKFPEEELTDEELFNRCQGRNEESIENYHRQKASDAVRNLALIIVSLPLFMLHFRAVYKDWKDEKQPVKRKKK